MISDRKLLFRAAMITVLIALVGVGVLYAILKMAGAEQPDLLDANMVESNHIALEEGDLLPVNDFFPDREMMDLEFIQKVFPVVSQWELESIQPYFSKETLMQSANGNDFSNVMTTLSANLGKLHSFEDPSRVEGWDAGWDSEGADLTEYRFLAFYELGQAEVNMVLDQNQGQNSLYAMTIDVIN